MQWKFKIVNFNEFQFISCLVILLQEGGFPIETETQISKLITYSLAIFELANFFCEFYKTT